MAQTTPTTTPLPILRIDPAAPHYKWFVAGTVLVAGATQTFGGGSSVTLALPRIMTAFGSDLATAQWIFTSYLITRTLMVPILGWLGGFLGYRNLFVGIMLGFVLTSIGCGLAVNLPMLIVFRLLQGLVMGPMEGLSAIIMVSTFPAHQRGMAIGLRTIGWSTGQIVSLVLGGYLIEHYSWRMIFFIGMPSGLVAAVLGFLLLPQQREYRGVPIDYAGLSALGLFLAPLLLAISFARRDDTETLSLVFLGLLAFSGAALFILRELYARHPAVNLHLFRIPAFRLLLTSAFFNTMGLFGAQFMIPIFLQQVMGLSPFQAGLVIVPALILSAFGGTLSGRLSDTFSPRTLILIGFTLLVIVFNLFATVSALTATSVLVGYIVLYRMCLFSINTPITALNVRIHQADQVRMGQGLLGMVRNIGASLGVTISSVIFVRRQTHHQMLAYSAYHETSPEHAETVREVELSLRQAGIGEADIGPLTSRAIRSQMDTEAVAAGFRDSFFTFGFFFLLAMLPMLFLTRRRLGERQSSGQ